jgi:threonine/homoserine/homoserine lactone efflux protein
MAFSIIKLLGVAYLLYLAWKTFRDKSIFEVVEMQRKLAS